MTDTTKQLTSVVLELGGKLCYDGRGCYNMLCLVDKTLHFGTSKEKL
ncbi:hypothetical protein GYH30_042924 [Glycine max]|nr:hypothetical protein GYH30_042924 [Glycine max]